MAILLIGWNFVVNLNLLLIKSLSYEKDKLNYLKSYLNGQNENSIAGLVNEIKLWNKIMTRNSALLKVGLVIQIH